MAKTKWNEWCPVFMNFLRTIPGQNGQPLSYVCRDNEDPIIDPTADFIDDYVNRAPLHGDAFAIDAAEVHIYIQSFIAGNETAEAKILVHANLNNGRLDFFSLKEHYEGVGANSKELLLADKILETLFYSGEKKPHMWWEEFEKQLTKAFTIYEKYEGRDVYSDLHKLRILSRKVNADFLQAIKTSINLELTRMPVTITYDQALTNFRNEVNLKFPPQLGNDNRRTRRINAVRGGGRTGRGGRGRGRGRYNNGRRGNIRDHHNGARIIQLEDGTSLEIHPAYHFTPEVWNKIPIQERNRLRDERIAYKRRRYNNNYNSNQNRNNNHSGQYPNAGGQSVISEITTNPPQGMSGQNSNINQQPNDN
jgi:hypothetical protein